MRTLVLWILIFSIAVDLVYLGTAVQLAINAWYMQTLYLSQFGLVVLAIAVLLDALLNWKVDSLYRELMERNKR